jgi:tetratricopeptide (TPR) repeat protein
MVHTPSENDGKIAQISRQVKLMDAAFMTKKATKAINSGCYADAIGFLDNAIESFRLGNDLKGEAEAYNMRAMCHAAEGTFDKAEQDLMASLKINEAMHDEEGAATDLLVLAKVRMRRQNRKGAKASAKRALALFQKLELAEEAQKAEKLLSTISSG